MRKYLVRGFRRTVAGRATERCIESRGGQSVGDVSGGGDEGLDLKGVQRCGEREAAVSGARF